MEISGQVNSTNRQRIKCLTQLLNMGWMFTIAVMMCKPFWEVRVLPSATMAPCVIHSNFIIIKIETVINTLKTYFNKSCKGVSVISIIHAAPIMWFEGVIMSVKWLIGEKRGHGGRVVTLSPPTSEAGVRFMALPQVGKLVVACRCSAVYSTEPWPTVCTGFLCPSNYPSWYDLYSVERDVNPK